MMDIFGLQAKHVLIVTTRDMRVWFSGSSGIL
jgi:hypothetical protein